MRWDQLLSQHWRLSHRHSALSYALGWETDNHRLNTRTDACKRSFDHGEDCTLRSGHEGAFVCATADAVFRAVETRLRHNGEKTPPYYQWVYLPNTAAEAIVGYDLSLGCYDDPHDRRVRTMHKLLLRWCDLAQPWSIEPGSGDHSHVKALVTNYRQSPGARPFLVLHFCYCIHDYRRMGDTIRGDDFVCTSPPFASLLRTVVIAIEELSDAMAKAGDPWVSLTLKYVRRWKNQRPALDIQARLDEFARQSNHEAWAYVDDGELIQLPVLDFGWWREHVATYLTGIELPPHASAKATGESR